VIVVLTWAGLVMAGLAGYGQVQQALKSLTVARGQLQRAKTLLQGENKYSCCVRPGCDFCPLNLEQCPCAQTLKEQKRVCPECYGGWRAGTGSVTGVKKEQVQVWSDDTLKKSYSARQDKR